jgi:Rrf2 family protein
MLTKTGLHAVRALVELARLPEGAYAGAASVARAVGAPPNYLGKLFQMLAREGLLQSQKGLGGGFRLARDPAEVSLLDVVEPIEQVSRWSGCILGRPECSDAAPCVLHERYKQVRNDYLRLLRDTSLADLLVKGEVAAGLA